MGVFEQFPYANMHEMNLEWLLKKMKELDKAMETFKATESLKFADPIIWDITTQYEKSTIVLDPTGNAYLSLQPVPTGIQLNNDDYWLEIFNFTEYTRTANQNLTVNTETNTTRATADYQVDDWLIWNDVLYRVTSAIAIDDALIVAPAAGSNIIHFTVEDFIKAFITYATGLINQYKNDIDASELAYRQQLAQDIATTTASLQAQLDAAIAGATVDSEVINARIGWDNTTYATLGEAIRSQISHIMNTAVTQRVENASDFNNHLSEINEPCVFAVGSSAAFTDKPPISSSFIFINIRYGSEPYFMQVAVALTSRIFIRFTNASATPVIDWIDANNLPSIALIDKCLKYTTINAADYSNLIANINIPVIAAVSKSSYNDYPDELLDSAAILINCNYGSGAAYVQFLVGYPSLRMYNRICTNGSVNANWQLLGAEYKTKWYALGDSITAGSYSNSQGEGIVATNAEWSYPRIIARNVGCEVHNIGVPGAAITELAAQVSQVPSTATLVTITGGANDYYGRTKPLGDVNSPADYNTVCGALKSAIIEIAQRATNARIVLMSPLIIKRGTLSTKWSLNHADQAGFTYAELSDAMKSIAEYYNIEFIDGTHEGPVNILNIGSVERDNVHPTKTFYYTYANWIESKLF